MPNTRLLSRSCCHSRLVSISASIAVYASTASSSPPRTASAASKPNGPENTDSAANAAVVGASSIRTLHSIVPRTVRWRSGRSRGPPTNRLSAESRRSRISAGDIVRVRAAASSMASGTPSSARTIPAMSAACTSLIRNDGFTAVARSTNRLTALAFAASVGDASASGTSSGPSSNVRSARTRSGERLVTSSCSRGSWVMRLTRSAVASRRCSMLSTTSSRSRPDSAVMSFVSRRSSPVSRTPTARAIMLITRSADVTDSRLAKATSRAAAESVSATSMARRDLPMPPGPTIVTIRTPGVASIASSRSCSPPRPTSRVYGAGIASGDSVADTATGAREASNRSARSVATSATISSPSSSGVENPR